MNYFESNNNALIFRNNGETVKISPWGENSFRVSAVFSGEINDDAIALLKAEDCCPEIIINERQASITNGKITAEMSFIRNYARIEFKNKNGEVILREINTVNALRKTPRQFRSLTGGTYRIKQSFEANADEKIYGMGQYQQEIMNLKGCNLELAHRNSQASIPFYLSSKGYGFLWHNAAIGEVHFGFNTTEWTAESSKQLDYWITVGDTPGEIMKTYTNVTGRAPMMPEYGLGYWQCKLRYYNQDEVLNIAREYKKRNIPIDVLVVDYYHWSRCGDFRFDEEFFPDPKSMVEELEKMGIRLMVSFWPQVDFRSENYEEMKQQGLLVKSASGVDVQMLFYGNNVFIDSTNPRTRKYVWDKCKKNYFDIGIKNFWLDEAEPEFIPYDFERYKYNIGPALEYSNVYPREYARLFYDGLMSQNEPAVSLCRCAWVGSQKYGALVWSGDIHSNYEDFRKQICAGIHMGISGIPWWTTDIGGFAGGRTDDENFRELLVRWFEYATFLPVMRMHGSRLPHKPIIDKKGERREVTGSDNEVWSFGEDNYEILKKFVNIRELMRDYTRSVMKSAHETGLPVIRGLFLEFPEDKECWDIKDEYMFGPDILVAPICYKGATSRSVYLPQGSKWIDARNGVQYDGGTTIDATAPIDTIPIFLKNGSQSYLIGKI